MVLPLNSNMKKTGVLNRMKILLIDSKEPASDELGRVLSDWGMTVKHAASGQKAVDLAREQLFDLVLMEFFLEDSMGVDVIRELKLFNPGVNIVVMAENSTPQLERKAREGGIVFYFGKPVPLDQLRLIVDQLHNKQI